MRFLLTTLFILLNASAHASVISGTAIVHDGDTIRIADTRIRIWGIDAVELKQRCGATACGEEARATLKDAIDNHSVTCTPKGKSYDRIVAICTIAGQDIGRLMTRSGMALDVKRYSQGFYASDEARARSAQRGIWATNFENPALWRKRHR